jgi:GxxExxY protein
MGMDEEKLNEITQKIIGCAFEVHNTLGSGFAERVYENALVHELLKIGLAVQQQVPVWCATKESSLESTLPT